MNAIETQRRTLLGTWWRVPEEETGGAAVYRREGTPLPPARGRDGFTLLEGGSAQVHGSGPTDRSTKTDSRWQLDAQGRLHVDGVSHLPSSVAALSDDRLTLT